MFSFGPGELLFRNTGRRARDTVDRPPPALTGHDHPAVDDPSADDPLMEDPTPTEDPLANDPLAGDPLADDPPPADNPLPVDDPPPVNNPPPVDDREPPSAWQSEPGPSAVSPDRNSRRKGQPRRPPHQAPGTAGKL